MVSQLANAVNTVVQYISEHHWLISPSEIVGLRYIDHPHRKTDWRRKPFTASLLLQVFQGQLACRPAVPEMASFTDTVCHSLEQHLV